MSRGLGRAQTELLRVIDQHDNYLDTFELARALYHPQEPADKSVLLSNAQVKATHRALRGLLNRGKIEEGGLGRYGRMQWGKLGSDERRTENIKNTLQQSIYEQIAAGHLANAFALQDALRRFEAKQNAPDEDFA